MTIKPARIVELMQEYQKKGNPVLALINYNAKNRKKLLDAAKFLRELELPAKAKFNLEHFGEHKSEHAPPEKNYCGTSACALGWMAIKNKFGFSAEWVRATTSVYENGGWFSRPTGEHILNVFHKRSDTAEFEAATNAFDFSEHSVADWLFLDSSYKMKSRTTKEDVAERLEFIEATNLAYPH